MKRFLKIILIGILVLTINIGFVGRALALSSSELISLTNQARGQRGLADLVVSSQLAAAAFQKANDMLENDYFSHTSPSGKSPWDFIKATGYSYTYAGENLAIGYSDASELHAAWMNSATHRENILNENFLQIGVAVVTGEYEGSQATVVVQMFGTPVSMAQETEPQVESTNQASQNSQETQVTTPSSNQEENLEIIKEKTDFSPGKIFQGEEVTFKVTLLSIPEKIVVQVGDEEIDLTQAEKSEKEGSEITFVKKVKIEKEGKLPVTLLVTSKNGVRQSLDLGKLEVQKKIISKTPVTTQLSFLEKSAGFVQKNLGILATMVIFLTLGLAAFLGFRWQKYGKLI